jgi:integrase
VATGARIRNAFENAVEAAGLGDFTFHDCRHHFASWFVMRGGSLQALKEGHRDITMTLRYAHLAPEHLRQEVAKTERSAAALSTTSAQSLRERVHSAGEVRVKS